MPPLALRNISYSIFNLSGSIYLLDRALPRTRGAIHRHTSRAETVSLLRHDGLKGRLVFAGVPEERRLVPDEGRARQPEADAALGPHPGHARAAAGDRRLHAHQRRLQVDQAQVSSLHVVLCFLCVVHVQDCEHFFSVIPLLLLFQKHFTLHWVEQSIFRIM